MVILGVENYTLEMDESDEAGLLNRTLKIERVDDEAWRFYELVGYETVAEATVTGRALAAMLAAAYEVHYADAMDWPGPAGIELP